MKFSSYFSVPSQKWQAIAENDIGDDQLTPYYRRPAHSVASLNTGAAKRAIRLT